MPGSLDTALQADPSQDGRQRTRARFGQADVVLLCLVSALLSGPFLGPVLDQPAVQTWCTMFIAIVLQAIPFLVMGVVLAAGISELVSEPLIRRVLPRNPVAAVPAAGLAGMALPGCECASVPIAASLIRRGAAPAAAFTFLLAGPAINPVVMVATAIAFPGQSDFVVARFAASLVTSVTVGWLWALKGKLVPLTLRDRRDHSHESGRSAGPMRAFALEARHEFLHTGGFLMIGAAIAAAVNTFLPRSLLAGVGGHAVVSVAVMATFAVIVAMCSEADAFVAASLTTFSLRSRLVFLVVGPAIDVKLAALQAGHFGKRFALVFGPLTFAVAVTTAVVLGHVLL
jgi:uncharacterized membrane protein YraQ (UPF0718 family)